MEKRHWFFDIVVLVIGGCIILYIYLSGANLRTQVLSPPVQPTGSTTTVDDCLNLSEDAANKCYRDIAIREKDSSVCDQITKYSQKKSCHREIQFAQ